MSRCWYYAMPGAESEMGMKRATTRRSNAGRSFHSREFELLGFSIAGQPNRGKHGQASYIFESIVRRAARLASYPLPASPTHEQKRDAVDALIDHVKVRDGTPLYVEIEWRV